MGEMIAAAVRRHAAERPGHAAVIEGGRTTTYAELDAAADAAAAWLADRAIGPGSRLAWIGPNSVSYAVAALAARRRGTCLVGLNFRGTRSEVEATLAIVRPAAVLAEPPSVSLLDGGGVATDVVDGLAGPWVSGVPVGPWAGGPGAAGLGGGPVQPVALDDDCIIYLTSGSTGQPKAAVHSYGALDRAVAETAPTGWGQDTVALVIPPLFDMAGSMWMLHTLLFGGTCVLSAGSADLLEPIAGHRVTHALMVPALLQRLVEQQQARPVAVDALECIAYGASPITPHLLAAALAAFDCAFEQMYGMSETGVASTLRPEDHHGARLRTAGRARPAVEVAAHDPDTGLRRPPGEPGELWIRSPYAMTRYLGDEPATARTRTPDGWIRSRDAGWVDADGYVTVAGRLDDMIISGGENVHPGEVEAVLAAVPAIAEVAVVGVPDDRWGERVVAVVVARPGLDLDVEEVGRAARADLAAYKCPGQVVVVDALPRNATGKLRRAAVRDLVPNLTGPAD